MLTVRKALNQLERDGAAKRGAGKVVRESDLPRTGDEPGVNPLDRFNGNEPTPELAAMFAELFEKLRDALHDDSLRQVLDLRLAGYTRDEIAERMSCSLAAVKQKARRHPPNLGGRGSLMSKRQVPKGDIGRCRPANLVDEACDRFEAGAWAGRPATPN